MKFFEFLNKTSEIPQAFGTLHLSFFISVFVISFILAFFLRKKKEIYLRIIFGVLWGIMIVLETFKLIKCNVDIENEQIISHFRPENLSFQFCSLPIYFLPVVIFAKEGKVRDIFSLFLATYGLVAGLCVYLFPVTVFGETVFFNYQTMIHHGIQIITGIVLLVVNYHKVNLNLFLRSALLFFFTVLGARFLNELMHCYYPNNIDIDYFYISPYTAREFPVVGNIKQLIPNCVFVLGYIVGFSFLAFAFNVLPGLFTFKFNCFKFEKQKGDVL